MVHMLEGMKGINLIMTYGGGTYDLHQFIPHQVRLVLLCGSAVLGLFYAQGGCFVALRSVSCSSVIST
jgi:hypothetical protein